MKIISYNIWNHKTNYDKRIHLLVKELQSYDGDVVALQEVRDERILLMLKDVLGYPYHLWKEYADCQEGLAILSKFDLKFNWSNWDSGVQFNNSGIINVTIKIDEYTIGITNVHLDYKRAYFREIEIVKAIKLIEEQKHDYDILLGDFNTYPNSSIHNYLIGSASLNKHSTSWIDLFDSFLSKKDLGKGITLDFNNNPRWDNEYTLDVPGRFDWILLKNPYPKEYPTLKDFKIIGDERRDNLTPSDHYGVLCEMDF